MSALLDSFVPNPDVRQRHEIMVQAPANLVMEVARTFDMQSVPIVHAIFWLRTRILRAKTPPPNQGIGIVASTQSIGWGVLLGDPDHAYVSGAASQPWQADVVFLPMPAKQFLAYAEPEHVKIVWSIETYFIAPTLTRLCSETRVVATDQPARAKFKRYWRIFGIGIRMIRWVLLRAVRQQAEQKWRMAHPTSTSKSIYTL
jgi:hypothetical protein